MAVEPSGSSAAVDAVIKLGGDVLEGPALAAVAADIARARDGGGWSSFTAVGRRRRRWRGGSGWSRAWSAGAAITDAPTLDVMKMVVAGRLNVDLVAALRAAGVPAVGLSGASGVIRAHRRPPRVVSGAGAEAGRLRAGR